MKKKFTVSLTTKSTGRNPLAPKPISELKPSYENVVDLRGEPTHVCICGSFVWNVKCSFEDYEMSFYYLDMECANCGSLATAPTPPAKPDYEKELDYLD
jgi:hypothetical protein